MLLTVSSSPTTQVSVCAYVCVCVRACVCVCVSTPACPLSTGYKQFKGQVLNSKDLQEIVSGLRENNLLRNYTHLLTGERQHTHTHTHSLTELQAANSLL